MQKYLDPKTNCKFCGRQQALTCETLKDLQTRSKFDKVCESAFTAARMLRHWKENERQD